MTTNSRSTRPPARSPTRSFGGLLGMGDKLCAVPWAAPALDTPNKRFTLNVSKSALKDAPGFDKDRWTAMSDRTCASGIQRF